MKPATGWWSSRGLGLAGIGRWSGSKNGRIRGMLQYVDLATLEESLDHIRKPPADSGTLELIVRRPAGDERELITEVRVDTVAGRERKTCAVPGGDRLEAGGQGP